MLTNSQIQKRNQIIENMIIDLMEGHDTKTATRNPISREEAEEKISWILKNEFYVKTINAMAAAWAN